MKKTAEQEVQIRRAVRELIVCNPLISGHQLRRNLGGWHTESIRGMRYMPSGQPNGPRTRLPIVPAPAGYRLKPVPFLVVMTVVRFGGESYTRGRNGKCRKATDASGTSQITCGACSSTEEQSVRGGKAEGPSPSMRPNLKIAENPRQLEHLYRFRPPVEWFFYCPLVQFPASRRGRRTGESTGGGPGAIR